MISFMCGREGEEHEKSWMDRRNRSLDCGV